MNKVVDPSKQIAKIMRTDAELIYDSDSINKMLKVLSDSNIKIHMILKGLQGEIN